MILLIPVTGYLMIIRVASTIFRSFYLLGDMDKKFGWFDPLAYGWNGMIEAMRIRAEFDKKCLEKAKELRNQHRSIMVGKTRNTFPSSIPLVPRNANNTLKSNQINIELETPSRNQVVENEIVQQTTHANDKEELDEAICMVYALYDYQAENKDELNLMEGDIIMVTELDNGDDADWWVGYAKNKMNVRGKFPKNFVSYMFQFKNDRYLISTTKHEVYRMGNMTECLGTFNDLTNVLTDGNGDEHDWNGAVLL